MPEKTGWDIRPPDIIKFLENIRLGTYDEDSLEATTTFTMLRNAKRGETEIAELVAAIGADEWGVGKLIAFPLERLILFETVAALATEVQMKEDDLSSLVQDMYRHHMTPKKPVIKQMEDLILKEAKWKSLKIIGEIDGATKDVSRKKEIISKGGAEADALNTFEIIKNRLISGVYKPDETIYDLAGKKIYDPSTAVTAANVDDIALALTEKIVNDKFYMQIARDTAKKYVDDKLKSVVDKGLVKYPGSNEPLRRLSIHTGEERRTFMLAGAPACGKGTIVAAMEMQAKEQFDLDWDDTVKINTDNYREIVSTAPGLGDDITVHSDLNTFEASFISDLANKRVQEQLNRNQGHHLVIDGVYPSANRLRMGTQNGGSLHIACVSVPVDVSVGRAFKRGQEIGRFVGSEYLISAHKAVSKDILKNIVTTCKDTNAELSVFNTNVPRGEQPIQAMQLNLSTKKAIIYDADAMAEIYGKKNIDPKALDSDHLYPPGVQELDYSYLSELESLGITVEFEDPEMQLKVEEIIRPASSMSM
ncbi:zeta toxin family protein [Legionella genomosp. 1]|uniref:zeta toxin family protein n=1 Tax=Legionella genomosp. 1 TaxID=1093625 RepID=UPI0010561ED3|nr:zeta toxin family protein [Legionella genomosp. 1]